MLLELLYDGDVFLATHDFVKKNGKMIRNTTFIEATNEQILSLPEFEIDPENIAISGEIPDMFKGRFYEDKDKRLYFVELSVDENSKVRHVYGRALVNDEHDEENVIYVL